MMKRVLILLFSLLVLLVSCQHQPIFSVTGSITGAEGQMLYLEHTTLVATSVADSCVLDECGVFSLQAPMPEYPDFYRLRVGALSLPLAVDSTETIVVTTTRDSLPYTLAIEGSASSLAIAQFRATARTVSYEVLREEAKRLIATNPLSLAAYYAVFFKQKGEYLWNILDPVDRRMYQAVATSFHTWMPDYERTKALYAQVKGVLEAERELKQQAAMQQIIDNAENTFLDIVLPDNNGITQSLSDLRGKVIILDFSAIDMEQSNGYIFELRDLYNQYSKQGLAIYSVSLDRNKLLWEDGVANLPWTNVYAGERAMDVLLRYNVQSLPTLFLLDRKGNVQGRYTDFNALEADIRKYL
ncbi:MAG: redoxin domain-containing protein [Paludibacteraceae bacterium]|nr:redoxin domain-containing protein [Paludibacteraceae bacterium]